MIIRRINGKGSGKTIAMGAVRALGMDYSGTPHAIFDIDDIKVNSDIKYRVKIGSLEIAHLMQKANERLTSDKKIEPASLTQDLANCLREIVTEIRAYQSPECDDTGALGAALLKRADELIAKASGGSQGRPVLGPAFYQE